MLGLVHVRIDQGFALDGWLNIYLEAKISHLPRFTFDHCLILTKFSDSQEKTNIPFRFEKIWMYIDGFYETIHKAWTYASNHSPGLRLSMLLQNTRRAIIRWKHNVGNIFVKG